MGKFALPILWGYKIMIRILTRLFFFWLSRNDDYVNVKTEWITK